MQSEGLNLGRAPAPASTLPWVALVAAVLLAVMAGPIARGDIWIRDDLGAFHLPLRSFYAESLREGWSFDWMPSVFSGFHLTGEGQAGTYHPWHRWLYGNLPVPLAFDLELILNYPLLLLGMYVWLRPHLESRGAALFGGVVFTFGGFNLLHFVHPNALAIVAHVPWLLVAHRAVAHRTRWQRGVAVWGVALLTASQVLLGYPQYVWFSVVIEAWYCLTLLSRTPAALGWMLGAKAAGLLIGAIQWLPTAVAFAEASRQDAAAAFYLRYSLHPANVIQLLSPYGLQDRVVGPNTHELGCYFGAIPMCLAAWLFIPGNLERRERRWRNAAIGLLLVGVILALGRYAGLFGLQLALPVIGRFRAPSRYLVLANFSIAVLAALALSRWERQGAKLESVRWIVAMPAISLVATFLLIALAPPGSLAGGLLPWLGVAMWSASGAAVLLAAWRPSVGLPLMVAVAALDLGSYGFSYAVMGPTVRQLVQVAPLQDPARPGDGKLFVGPDAWDARSPRRLGNSLVLRGWTQADGYAGLEPRSLLLSDPIGRSNLQAAGVKWVRSGSVKQPIPGLVEAVPGWLEVPDPVPRFRLVTRTLVTTRPGVDMHAADPHRIALVEHDVTLRDGDPGRLRVVRDRPGEIVVDVRCRGPQLLVTTERFHPGWRVLGHSGQLVRVNGDFLGVRVEPGERRVTLRFVPPGLATGHRLALVGSLGLLVAQLAARARPRSNKEARGRLWRN